MTDHSSPRHRDTSTATTRVAAHLVALALATTACSKDMPTEPTSGLTPIATPIMTPAGHAAAGALLEDASARLMPSLADAAAQAKLRGHLEDLSAALQGNNAAKARRQIDLARKMMAALAASPDAADLAVLRITLDQVEAQLDGASALHPQP